MQKVLEEYGFESGDCIISPLGNGLINSTWLVERGTAAYVLQKINQQIFKQPELIAQNIRLIQDFLAKEFPAYLFVGAIPTATGKDMVKIADGYFRLFPFVNGSHTVDVLEQPAQAYEAARQFGAFTKRLQGMDIRKLQVTLPDFHNLALRYSQFESSLINGNKERIKDGKQLIEKLQSYHSIVEVFEKIKNSLVMRCTHHDTKISNVLFDGADKGLCVIDLDTVMPGYFISDVGDMMRTYLCPVSEEEQDFDKINIRPAFYESIKAGYLSEMNSILTDTELNSFHYAGQYMIYMQALRFLTDHLNEDIYYGAKYPGHNLVRAGNQACLLEKLIAFNPTAN